MDRDDVPGGGFVVVAAELERAADVLVGASEVAAHHRQRERQHHGGGLPLPGWLSHADRDWCLQRDQLITALGSAAGQLNATWRSYLQVDHHLTDELAATVDQLDPTPSSAPPPPPCPPIPDTSERNDAHGTEPELGGTDLPLPPLLCELAQLGAPPLEQAAALWRHRALAADHITRTLASEIDLSQWRGGAADAYRRWLSDQLAGWVRLNADAERIAHALTHHLPPPPPGPVAVGSCPRSPTSTPPSTSTST